MGNSIYAFLSLFNEFGIEVVIPERPNKTSLEIGVKYSPEFVCFPFKATLGDFINLLEKENVDTIVMATDCGPCRFGFYHAVQKRILDKLSRDLGATLRD